MAGQTHREPSLATKYKLVGRAGRSRLMAWLANLAPVSWLIRALARPFIRRTLQSGAARPAAVEKVVGVDLQSTLARIVRDVVTDLGSDYAAAFLAPYEQGDVLPVRALYIDPHIASLEQIKAWQAQVSTYSDVPISLTDPQVARVYVYNPEQRDNLSVQAFLQGRPVISGELYSLFTPIAPPASRPLVQEIQRQLGIAQVIAVPFFLDVTRDGQPAKEMVGNLFAVKRSPFTAADERILSAFADQAAAAIEGEQRRVQLQIMQEIVLAIQSNLEHEDQILRRIAQGVVSGLGYVGAMVATAEADGSLPIRAISFDPGLATLEQIHEWEAQISRYSEAPVSITDPQVARVYVRDPRYQDNLSVKAFHKRAPSFDDALFSLFTPIAPPSSRPVVDGIQEVLGIHKVIAVPFFLQDELVGNLFAISRSREFRGREIEVLQAFGLQAAVGIQNARLYRRSEERRMAAQIFGKMAFSSSAYVHELRNHVGTFNMYAQLLQLKAQSAGGDSVKAFVLQQGSGIKDSLNKAADILDNLHEPWRDMPDQSTDVNACLDRALGKIFPALTINPINMNAWEGQADTGLALHLALSDRLPPIRTSPDMLTEAFKVVIKNAVEAVREKHGPEGDGHIWIKSSPADGAAGRPAIQVSVRDNGTGIKPENQSKLFEIRWSTKGGRGMGFGLFWTKDYVDGLGGSISADSVWGEGTTLYLRLPGRTVGEENHGC